MFRKLELSEIPSWKGVFQQLIAPKSHNRNRSDFRVDGAKSPEIPQKEGVLGSEIAARNRKSLATFHRTLKSQCSIAFSCLGNRCDFWGPRWASRSQIAKIAAIRCAKSNKFRCRWKILPRFSGSTKHAVPGKSLVSGKEHGCWKIGLAFGNAPGFSPPRPPQPS